ncbi:MAG: hypothetical protein CSA72_02720 [Rhodobacterales bacterium]|nr:MAG: hypothetical protein CSA72_02720 [Rhodobacterales bacterium]
MRIFLIFALYLLSFCPLSASAKDIALIIGNARYGELIDLRNPVGDASAFAAAFESLGYDVHLESNLSRRGMIRAMDRLTRLIEEGDRVAFVYSGHGWSDGGENFLVPTDAPARGGGSLLRQESVALESYVLSEIRAAGAKLTFAIIDACRNNPFELPEGAKSVDGTGGKGLTIAPGPRGSFIVYSASRGQISYDRLPDDPREQRLSVFARSLVPLLETHEPLQTSVKRAQRMTRDLVATINKEQVPSYVDEVEGLACLTDRCQSLQAPAFQACERRLSTARGRLALCDPGWQEHLEACPDHQAARILRLDRESLCSASGAALTSREKILACDRAAGSEFFESELPSGVLSVDFSDIAPAEAIAACRAAFDAAPSNLRVGYQLARSLRAEGGEANNSEAEGIYLTACQRHNNPAACFGAGKALASSDPDRAAALLDQSCKLKDGRASALACTNLAYLYRDGAGSLDEDLDTAIDLFIEACDLGEPWGCNGAAYQLSEAEGQTDFDLPQSLAKRGCDMHYGRGSAASCNTLGVAYEEGEGKLEPDNPTAIDYYQQACELGSAYGCNNWGDILALEGPLQSAERAARLFERICEQGDGLTSAYSCYDLGSLYANGTGEFEEDYDRAAPFYAQACELGYVWGCENAGAHWRDSSEPELRDRAMELLRKGCDMKEGFGSGRSCNKLAMALERPATKDEFSPETFNEILDLYEQGCELGPSFICSNPLYALWDYEETRDPQRALRLMKIGCESEMIDDTSCVVWAEAYRDGTAPVEKNPARASELLRRACTTKYPSASAGIALFELEAVRGDKEEGLACLEKSCEGDDSEACLVLGEIYAAGNGVRKNAATASSYFEQACSKSYISGGAGVAMMSTPGIAPDAQAALSCLQKSCDQLTGYACFHIGYFYDQGFSELISADEAAEALVKGRELYDRNLPNFAASFPVDLRRALQRKLKERGLYNGAIDGVIGAGTLAAIERL